MSVHDVVDIISIAVKSFVLDSSGFSSSPMKGVFNVGGPEGVSRLQLAQRLARSSSVDLQVHEAKQDGVGVEEKKDEWCVYASSNLDSIIVPGIFNPRDVTMDSSKTELVFGKKFVSTCDIFLNSRTD